MAGQTPTLVRPEAYALLEFDGILAAGILERRPEELERLRELAQQAPTVAFSRQDLSRARSTTQALGGLEDLQLIHASSAEQAIAQLTWLKEETPVDSPRRLFVVSSHSHDLVWASEFHQPGWNLAPVNLALASPVREIARGELMCRTIAEACDLVLCPSLTQGLSVVLMAFNERDTIAGAICEVRRFCRLYCQRYEILVVDDGSRDGTAEAARAEDLGDVHVLVHTHNRGMGAAMRTGYLAARLEYLVSLPADRQIRAQQLAPFLAQLSAHRCVHGWYRVPHSGPARALMSYAFRLILRQVGGLTTDFAGAYIFHRHWLQRIDLTRLPSQSFVFSFELLDALAQLGCQFSRVELRAFAREVGSSRVARPSRIAHVFVEVLKSRLKRPRNRHH